MKSGLSDKVWLAFAYRGRLTYQWQTEEGVG